MASSWQGEWSSAGQGEAEGAAALVLCLGKVLPKQCATRAQVDHFGEVSVLYFHQ